MNIRSCVGIGFLALLLVGCSPLVGQAQSTVLSTSTFISAGQTVGQTFTALNGGLVGLAIYLTAEQPSSSQILLHLRSSPDSKIDLASATLPVSQVDHPGYYNFSFTPLPGSFKADYYLVMEVSGAGKVAVGSADGGAYLDGSLYVNGQPVDAQLAFHPYYTFHLALLAILMQSLGWLWQLVLILFLFMVPGWALLSGLWPGWADRNMGEKTGLATGVSVVLYPILFLWTHLIGLNLGAIYAWLPAIIGSAFLVWKNLFPINRLVDYLRHPKAIKLWAQPTPQDWLPDIGLIIVVIMIVCVRLWVSRTLAIPLWGDSYQHTLMAQLLVDHRGLFDSWQPYADLQTFTYHFGFHASVAVFHWLSGVDVPGAVLAVGQWFNVLAVIALYPLAYRLTRQKWAGTFAVLVAGLLLSVPMIYINWGRYTQLAGQLVLPGAICLAWDALELPRFSWRHITLAGIAMGGLALTHYRILIFAACFFPAWLIINIRRNNWRLLITRLTILAMIAFVLFLPWFIHVYGGTLMKSLLKSMSVPSQPGGGQEINPQGDLLGFLPQAVWLILACCLAWGFWRRERTIFVFGLWWFLVALLVNPQWLNLPGAGTLTNFALAIAAYIPASLLLGAAISWLVQYDHWLSSPLVQIGLLILLIIAGFWGSRSRLRDLNSLAGTLVTRPDLRAMAWIQANTPQDSRFLVNSFFTNGSSSVVGADAGWWLPLLAHRQSTLPPLTYVSEQGHRPDYVQWVNRLTQHLLAIGLTDQGSLDLLKEYGVTYLYIGQRQGKVNNNGAVLLDPMMLKNDQDFTVVYHQDRVWIFQLAR